MQYCNYQDIAASILQKQKRKPLYVWLQAYRQDRSWKRTTSKYVPLYCSNWVFNRHDTFILWILKSWMQAFLNTMSSRTLWYYTFTWNSKLFALIWWQVVIASTMRWSEWTEFVRCSTHWELPIKLCPAQLTMDDICNLNSPSAFCPNDTEWMTLVCRFPPGCRWVSVNLLTSRQLQQWVSPEGAIDYFAPSRTPPTLPFASWTSSLLCLVFFPRTGN